MATATVSASVDANVKAVANEYIRKAGLTPNELIRDLWESIANTGVVPEFDDSGDKRRQARLAAFKDTQSIIVNLPRGTKLDTMTYDDMRREFENRDV